MFSIPFKRFAAPALVAGLLAIGVTAPAEAARLRVWSGHPDGSVSSVTRGGRVGPYGGYATHAARNTFNPDGSATHAGRFTAANARGSISSTSSASRDGEGNASASRQTTLTSAATGNSAHVDTSYSRTDSGVSAQRSVSCNDAAGNAIACR